MKVRKSHASVVHSGRVQGPNGNRLNSRPFFATINARVLASQRLMVLMLTQIVRCCGGATGRCFWETPSLPFGIQSATAEPQNRFLKRSRASQRREVGENRR